MLIHISVGMLSMSGKLVTLKFYMEPSIIVWYQRPSQTAGTKKLKEVNQSEIVNSIIQSTILLRRTLIHLEMQEKIKLNS
jgi:hypothetical protein